MSLLLREWLASDLPFMRRMLYDAVFWRRGKDGPPYEEALAYPEVARSLEHWGARAGDTGVVATVGSQLAGAAWYRFWTTDSHIRGYFDPTMPVLVIGVQSDHRRRGIGGAMIEWLVKSAQAQDISGISLCVAKDNHALRLYRQQGFVKHSELGDSLLMVRSVEPQASRDSATMDDGSYEITVRTGDGAVGAAVTVAAGRFSGAAQGYAVRGHIIDDTVGVVEILKTDQDAPSRLGLFKHITVPVGVTITGQPTSFRMQGRVNGHHVIEVTLEGRWIGELPETVGA